MNTSQNQNAIGFIGKSANPEYLDPRFATYHGLVTGERGTGRTVTLQVLAETFSDLGIPVFAFDVTGDLSGLAAPGDRTDDVVSRAEVVGLGSKYEPKAYPCIFWDVIGKNGHPIRTSIADFSHELLSRLLDLNKDEEAVLTMAFRRASLHSDPIQDLTNLRQMISGLATDAGTFENSGVSTDLIGTVRQKLRSLADQGGDQFFSTPSADISDFLQTRDGRGFINLLDAPEELDRPRLYGVLLLWLLEKIYDSLEELGDRQDLRLVLLLDEAQHMFKYAGKKQLNRLAWIIEHIGSKGVGIYFCVPDPALIPDRIAAQCGNRIQHALCTQPRGRVQTPKGLCNTFRPNPELNIESTVTSLAVGQALTSFLEKEGEPSVAQRTTIRPPYSRIGALSDSERRTAIASSPLYGKYEVN